MDESLKFFQQLISDVPQVIKNCLSIKIYIINFFYKERQNNSQSDLSIVSIIKWNLHPFTRFTWFHNQGNDVSLMGNLISLRVVLVTRSGWIDGGASLRDIRKRNKKAMPSV